MVTTLMPRNGPGARWPRSITTSPQLFDCCQIMVEPDDFYSSLLLYHRPTSKVVDIVSWCWPVRMRIRNHVAVQRFA